MTKKPGGVATGGRTGAFRRIACANTEAGGTCRRGHRHRHSHSTDLGDGHAARPVAALTVGEIANMAPGQITNALTQLPQFYASATAATFNAREQRLLQPRPAAAASICAASARSAR